MKKSSDTDNKFDKIDLSHKNRLSDSLTKRLSHGFRRIDITHKSHVPLL